MLTPSNLPSLFLEKLSPSLFLIKINIRILPDMVPLLFNSIFLGDERSLLRVIVYAKIRMKYQSLFYNLIFCGWWCAP